MGSSGRRSEEKKIRRKLKVKLSKLDLMVKGITSPKVNLDQCIKDLEILYDLVKLTNQEWSKVMAKVFGLKWE